MKKHLVAALAILSSLPACADEGMWLLNQPPRERLARDYRFDLKQDWLDHQMRSSVRFNNGGSGSFVSKDGLVITNHHIGADSLQKLSKPGKDLVHLGFFAPTREAEPKCPDLELNCLQSIEDVTARVEASVQPGMEPAKASAARRAFMSTLEKEESTRTGLRCDIVTLYQGGAYHLYRYKKYTDVRLVMAPEYDIAFFGGDADNFEYPRFNFDVCFFRVYENGKPLQPKDYLPFNEGGVKEGDLVFVVGHPGRTNRLDTMARLEHLRDITLPYRLGVYREEEAVLRQFSQRGPEQARQAQEDLYSIANARKATTGQYYGLLDEGLMRIKAGLEKTMRDKVAANPELNAKAGPSWEAVKQAQQRLAAFEKEYFILEMRHGVNSRLYEIARHIVRLAEEKTKPNGERMREYRDSNLASLEQDLFSPAPISKDVEEARLASSLGFAGETLGGPHPFVRQLLGGLSPEARAAQLVEGCTLASVEARRSLLNSGLAGLQASQDSMIRLAIALNKESRQLRGRFDSEVDEPERQAYAQIARAQFALEGATVAPDATFTLRLAYGRVSGYAEGSRARPFATTFGGLFRTARDHKQSEPFALPPRWLQGEKKLNPNTAFDFVSTADTIGGNSGSPVVNRKGEFVGINFDRNRFGLVRNFLYTDVQARHISVHAPAILEALDRLYGYGRLVDELRGH